ncbi:MAG: o-succinylbenzoate synthase [Desulfobacterales bacterium C00003060]|nr:MAG: o-succinylbenzoate synthase [Desulfobacterales bacterium C00003060]OEU83861.1 MAG: o-succinylbenzoate synthase [Desulfobacterales bacterium S5133MH4]
MKIRRLSLIDFELTFKAPLVTAHGLLNLRKGIIICAKTDDGCSGIGEISPLDGFNRESRSRAKQSAQEVAGYLDNAELPVDPEGLIQILGDLEDRLSAPPSVIFGFEMLLGDLAGKKAELPLSTWYCNNPLRNVAVNAILAGSPEDIQGQLAQKAARHFRAYKIKIEAGGIEPAIQKIKTVRDRVADDVMIRLDLNRGLDLNEAVDLLNEIKGFGIEYVEEPLKEPTSHDMIALREETGLRIALDETVAETDRFHDLLENKACDVIVLKPMMLGGINKSVKLSRMAAEQGLKTVLTSTLESGIGVTACLHAAAMLGHHVLACGLDTLDLFQDSIINEDLPIISGRMNVPQRPGLGVSLRPSLIPSTI